MPPVHLDFDPELLVCCGDCLSHENGSLPCAGRLAEKGLEKGRKKEDPPRYHGPDQRVPLKENRLQDPSVRFHVRGWGGCPTSTRGEVARCERAVSIRRRPLAHILFGSSDLTAEHLHKAPLDRSIAIFSAKYGLRSQKGNPRSSGHQRSIHRASKVMY